MKQAVTQANGIVDVGERVKLPSELGHGSAWAQLPVRAVQDVLEIGLQPARKVARNSCCFERVKPMVQCINLPRELKPPVYDDPSIR